MHECSMFLAHLTAWASDDAYLHKEEASYLWGFSTELKQTPEAVHPQRYLEKTPTLAHEGRKQLASCGWRKPQPGRRYWAMMWDHLTRWTFNKHQLCYAMLVGPTVLASAWMTSFALSTQRPCLAGLRPQCSDARAGAGAAKPQIEAPHPYARKGSGSSGARAEAAPPAGAFGAAPPPELPWSRSWSPAKHGQSRGTFSSSNILRKATIALFVVI
jgi:hypothetical protein